MSDFMDFLRTKPAKMAATGLALGTLMLMMPQRKHEHLISASKCKMEAETAGLYLNILKGATLSLH